MPVVKGGVWTNIEDEILKASVSKYGLHQWARVSSLLARKTAKQCKARWNQWLDPAIRKTEWSKEEDEKLLHLAKLLPQQWVTIAPIVGRTAQQCIERYDKLLNEAQAKENDELGMTGPDGPEGQAPSADDVRRLRPGELDPDPESKPARPDTIDLDEDEKEMLSEARARLANTQGKKAKRKARERQLEESRRLASLQKRRELKNAGINIKIINRKKGQMDYNADIPFEKKAAPGFYDTKEEMERNEKQREAFDPRKQQLANKRKGDPQEDESDRKKRKGDKNAPSAAFAAAAKAGQMQKIREAEQSSKRRSLVLPAPQVGESELEDIVKMGIAGSYSDIVGRTPIRTPRAPPQEDHIANEIRNIRALTETQSSLLGGENTPLHEGAGSTGFDGVTPRKNVMATPNPMATPLRNGIAAKPGGTGPGATPLRTPRDNFAINRDGFDQSQLVGSTPREIKMREEAQRNQLKSKFASLPKPKESEWELELPEEQQEPNGDIDLSEEDASERDRRNAAIQEAARNAELRRRTQVLQRGLPRPTISDSNSLIGLIAELRDPAEKLIAEEMLSLMKNDAYKYPDGVARGKRPAKQLIFLNDELLANARMELLKEASSVNGEGQADASAESDIASKVPGGCGDKDAYKPQFMASVFSDIQDSIVGKAKDGNEKEKKLALHLGGYQQRAKTLRHKIGEAAGALQTAAANLDSFKTLQIVEQAAIPRRLDGLRGEVSFVSRREREGQELYKTRMEELRGLEESLVAA